MDDRIATDVTTTIARWGTIDVPQAPANCAFGGADRRTLYVTARTALYSTSLPIAGR